MEGMPALEALLHAGAPIHAVLTLTPELAAARSAAADYGPVCQRYGVPLYHISNINDAASARILCRIAPDVVFVIGWHQRVRPATLRIARLGVVAAHASLLPHNRGNAPINWAIIRGEERTGNTLYWMAENPDDIEIIDQTGFPITPYDTCATLYSRVALSNRAMLLRLLPLLLAGQRPGWLQPKPTEPLLPRRRPADGRIDWNRPSRAVYDFIRALTRPYPGAFSTLDQQRWLIWRAALLPAGDTSAPAGTILGPVFSPVHGSCGQLVACGTGAVILLELERPNADLLRGYTVSEQAWTGWRWRDA